MADNVKYRFIDNVGDYFPAGYFSEDFDAKVQRASGLSKDDMKALCPPFVALRAEYEKYKNYIVNQNPRVKDAILHTHDFNTRLLRILGYETKGAYQFVSVNEELQQVVPVRQILTHGSNNAVRMLVMEMQHLIKTGEEEPSGLFEQHYDTDEQDSPTTVRHQQFYAGQWSEVFTVPEGCHISPAVINKAIDALFLLPEERRPHFILMLAGNVIFLFDVDRWSHGSYLRFSLDELFSQASISTFRHYYALFHLLVCKETLAADSETVLMDTLIEESYKSAYEVTKDLKEGVIHAVETLANEALYWWKQTGTLPVDDYTDDLFESHVKDDCLTIVYRLLFVFYAESRDELEILPTRDPIYQHGYSLEMLRDLEQVRLIGADTRNGYFFHESLTHVFSMLSTGYKMNAVRSFSDKSKRVDKSFMVRRIDSPLFDNRRLHYLGDVKIRNAQWQEIICSLSLSRRQGNCGRISYANLGVNQLGSVYESLLAYRGFYAEEDYIEVHKADKPDEGTFLVPYSRMDAFESNEILRDKETGEPVVLPQGTFVYRLNGRDRQKSASYYTPEVLTRSTVKYTLKAILDDVHEGRRKATELLDLKILEPAMGAAAFQNEVVNQLAKAYLEYRQEEKRREGVSTWRIAPDEYRNELQKVKAYIATHNVYGVDLNPTAIELGKLALWLNVMHKDMETPFFSNRLALGNAVMGAWLKVYDARDVRAKNVAGGRKGNKQLPNEWWTKAPHKVHFGKTSVQRSVNEVYHFLLPDKNMLAVRTIREQKTAHRAEDSRMAELIKDWTAPVTADDWKTLVRISAAIDVRLKEYLQFQLSIEQQTNNRKNIWGVPGDAMLNLDSYAQKEELNNQRYRHDNAYYRLRMVMDYWCALWCWEYDETKELPTRSQYWSDIEAILAVKDEDLDANTRRSLGIYKAKAYENSLAEVVASIHNDGMNDLFASDGNVAEDTEEYRGITEADLQSEEEAEIVMLSKEELLANTQGEYQDDLFNESRRFQNVRRYAQRYHFFHPMLEFLEVFWLRDGFDIICGNPPWLNYEFDEQGIISEKYPEVAIRNMSAPEVRKKRDELFVSSHFLETLYRAEEIETACSAAFMSAECNYPLLQGVRTNLYKCVLENGFSMLSDNGFMGMLHPESVYDDAKGQLLRKEVYQRLRYHFQYENELNLFTGTNDHGRMRFGENVYGSRQKEVDFWGMNNVFHPATIDSSFVHNGHGLCGGLKTNDGKWNTEPHLNRIVHFKQKELQIIADAFESGCDWSSVKLVSIHSRSIINVLQALSSMRTVASYQTIITEGLNETTSVDKGYITRHTKYPNSNDYEMIYSGPHFFVGNPVYKTPKSTCLQNSDYDIINLCSIKEDYCARTNYVPTINKTNFEKLILGFVIGQDEFGNTQFDSWLDYYKAGFRRQIGPSSERSLSGAILKKHCSHIGGVTTVCFKKTEDMLEFSGITSSIVMDFYVKTLGASDVRSHLINTFPLGIASKYKPALFTRTLLLNCLTSAYAALWEDMWDDSYNNESWSKQDTRLKEFSHLHKDWAWDIPLRNYFERRQALVEIDVIAAMALGLTLQDLEMIYTIQFPVLQQNENDTWYDAEGKIVFTCSKGLTGVGLDRPAWNAMRGEAITDQEGHITAYAGNEPTYEHTIDPKKSELYGGTKQTFIAPYTVCDRIADYRRAWAHFEKFSNRF